MPIKVNPYLPAMEQLATENIFVIDEQDALSQDIRPLRLLIVNLMPTKEVTETQLLRLLGNTPLQVDVTFLRMEHYQAKHTSAEHLRSFYKTLDDVKEDFFDGMIITGAPIEHLPFEEVDYWEELVQVMDWSVAHVFSTFHICWGAQAGLYHHYGIQKHPLPEKLFGVFEHTPVASSTLLLQGMDDVFYLPHSRHTTIQKEDVDGAPELEVVVESQDAGVTVVRSHDNRHVFITGHAEYDADTLEKEYQRDIAKGLTLAVPKNYYPANDPSQKPLVRWRSTANLLFSNWLNYYVYQETPYELRKLQEKEQL